MDDDNIKGIILRVEKDILANLEEALASAERSVHECSRQMRDLGKRLTKGDTSSQRRVRRTRRRKSVD